MEEYTILSDDNDGKPGPLPRTHCKTAWVDSQPTPHQVDDLEQSTTRPGLQNDQAENAHHKTDQSSAHNQYKDAPACRMEECTILFDDNDDIPGTWPRTHCKKE